MKAQGVVKKCEEPQAPWATGKLTLLRQKKLIGGCLKGWTAVKGSRTYTNSQLPAETWTLQPTDARPPQSTEFSYFEAGGVPASQHLVRNFG